MWAARPLEGLTPLLGGFGRHHLHVPLTGEQVDLGAEATMLVDHNGDVYLVRTFAS